ncbi:acyl CoA binding protein-domain-containing protein [Melampsora americana]|nr:acyl CoA binding protein-domain-containing protein [Melampsora americana]
MSYKKDSLSLNIPHGSLVSTSLSPYGSRRNKVPETEEEIEYHLKFMDPLFQTASHIVQTRLPASGPIQPTYKEKLLLYSFFKQAVNGDVQQISSRPGLFDMLGRAKWDSWKKLEGLQPVDAKKLYVETLLKVCDMSARISLNNLLRSGS